MCLAGPAAPRACGLVSGACVCLNRLQSPFSTHAISLRSRLGCCSFSCDVAMPSCCTLHYILRIRNGHNHCACSYTTHRAMLTYNVYPELLLSSHVRDVHLVSHSSTYPKCSRSSSSCVSGLVCTERLPKPRRT